MQVPPLLWVAVGFCLIPQAAAHVRMVCPKPKSPASSLYRQPPGSTSDRQCDVKPSPPGREPYTMLNPGPYTIRFEETEYHKNSPFRISLHQYGNNSTYCILLDQIPHNNEASTIGTYCKTDGGIIGECRGSTYYITVKIPDIDCNNCYLQVTFVNTDTATGDTCSLDDDLCTAYCSVANVRIKATEPGIRNLSSCERYANNLYGKWPYAPVETYQVNVEDLDPITIVHDVTQQTFHFQSAALSKGMIEALSICNEVNNTSNQHSMVFQVPVTQSNNSELIATYNWGTNITQSDLDLLKTGQLHLHLVTVDQKELYPVINLTKLRYESGIYRQHSALYSTDGWLAGPEFIGPNATYSAISWSFGTCTYPARYYISRLHSVGEDSHNSSLPHGVIGLTIMESRVIVSGTFLSLSSDVKEVRFIGPDLGGAPDLVVNVLNQTDDDSFTMSIDASEQIPFLSTVQFLKKVAVYTVFSDTQPEMEGDLEEGMLSDIRGPDMRLMGQSVFQFTQDGEWQGTLIIKKNTPPVKKVKIFSASHQYEPDTEVLDLKKYIKHQPDSTIFAVLAISDLDSEFFMNLWLGNLYICLEIAGMTVNHHRYKGEISRPGDWYCKSETYGFCPVTVLQHTVLENYHQFNDLSPSGLAAFVLNRANVFYYSISLQGLSPVEKVLDVFILNNGQSLLTVGGTAHSARHEDGTFHIKGFVPTHPPEMLDYLTKGTLKIKIKTTLFKDSGITGNIPKLRRTVCSKPEYIKVGGEVGWEANNTAIKNFSIVAGDILYFSYSGDDKVALLQDKEHFQTCNFQGEQQIGHTLLTHSNKNSIQHTFNTPGTFFIASQIACNHTPPLKFILTVVEDAPANKKFSKSQCEDSAYLLWRQAELNKYKGVDGVGASLGGVVVGLLILSVILLWDCHINSESLGSNGFERF